jgi:transcriptional regulator with XRE-family HTH domain
MSNYSQREMPMLAEMRRPEDVPAELIKHCKDELSALNLCMNLSNLSDEAIREALGIDKGHFSRLRKGRGNFPSNKRLDLMALCGNRAPAQFEAYRLNCDLVDKSKDAQIRELEQQLLALKKAA